jgi:NAD+ synthase (glutamine-hydrolysing)
MSFFRIALAQINTRVGDLSGNVNLISRNIEQAKEMGADIVAFPELAITGYPPEDLLLKPGFIEDNLIAIEELAKSISRITAIVGFVHREDDIYNSAAIIEDGKIVAVYKKIYLPNYSVFDEERYFKHGYEYTVFKKGDLTFAVNICEDIWYADDPGKIQSLAGGAELILNISSSPYHLGKPEQRENMLRTRASDYSSFLAFVNLVGGQDELVFDGHSVVIGPDGEVLSRAKGFEEDIIVFDIEPEMAFASRLRDTRRRREEIDESDVGGKVRFISLSDSYAEKKPEIKPVINSLPDGAENEIYRALILGTRDYVSKNHFSDVVVGLSGGIDSSLTVAIAVDALGFDHVHSIFMPSRYTKEDSEKDAKSLVKNLGVDLIEIPVASTFDFYLNILSKHFKGLPSDTTEENLQARIRGNILMAFSNKFNWLVLATGNKSEISTGYCTLYGDMVGGFSVLKDVYKTLVWDIAKYINKINNREVIPESIIEKSPSAELKEGQFDTDTLPSYDRLDPILKAYVEEDADIETIVAMGFERDIVEKVIKFVDANEYKRRQGAIGIRITPRAFGKDRRFPITNWYSG